VGVEVGAVAADRAGAFQGVQATVARGDAQSDALGQFGDRQSPVLSPASPQAGAEPAPGSWVRQAVKGLGISGLNPKVFLLFLALLPQFTDPDAGWPLVEQIAVLGLVHVASCAVVYTGVGAGARRVLRVPPAAALWATRFSGSVMVVIGVLLLVEHVVV
jgi:threonine/homoserine/homoserine lactone efflux protein